MLIGILIASLFTVVGAVSIGAPWQIIPAGVLAGIMASVEASRVHDQEANAPVTTIINRGAGDRESRAQASRQLQRMSTVRRE